MNTLGASLAALGLATIALLVVWRRSNSRWTGWAAAGALAIGEGTNAVAIHQVGSLLFVGPVLCVAAVILGVALGEYARGFTAGQDEARLIRQQRR